MTAYALPRHVTTPLTFTVNMAEARITDPNLLLAASGRGDQKAFATLYDQVAGAVYGTIRRILRDEAMSEEVTQDVMLEIWRRSSMYDPDKGAAVTWIMTTAHRRAIDRVRSEEAHRRRTRETGIAEFERDFDSTADAAVTRTEQDRVARLMGTLTDLEREAITLAFFGGMTHSEISEHLNVPLGTIKSRMRSGLMRLRDERERSSGGL